MDEDRDWIVADRSFPAYYYPLVYFLNNPEVDEESHKKVTMKAFWLHLELSDEETVKPFEKDFSTMVPDEDFIWQELKQRFSKWVLTPESDEATRTILEKILFVGALAPFVKAE